MKHILEQKVYYSDTDSYGVVWHGSYLRWLEMGRVEYCENLGLNLIELQNQDIVLPVTNLNIKYKSSAKLNDEIIIETEITELKSYCVTFKQIIKSAQTGKTYIEADVAVVAINNAGKLYRKLPDVLSEKFNEVLKCPALV